MANNTLNDLLEQISDFEKRLSIMNDNKNKIQNEIYKLKFEGELIEGQAYLLYDEAKKELLNISSFSSDDLDYNDKIIEEQKYIKKLNIAEKILGINITEQPNRVITSDMRDEAHNNVVQ